MAGCKPGKSTNARSLTVGPDISRIIEFFENLDSFGFENGRSTVKKSFAGMPGLRTASCALLIRSSISNFEVWVFSKMVSPNGRIVVLSSGLPYLSTEKRIETLACQGSSENDRRHSVGHLGRSA